ncbi:MAG TPA: integrase core domain-containing protein [Chloroflexia bacterium]|nr:integrase core domain-containing protein [Chloroflexia bacterium]
MNDELKWQADRSLLRRLHLEHPDWNNLQLAQATQRSPAWVRKWLTRLAGTALNDPAPLASQSRKRKTPPPPSKVTPLVVERILAIRDHPPDQLGRTPGPRTIAYYLARDPILKEQGITPPTSTATIYAVLLKYGKLGRARPPSHKPLELPPPLTSWQIDFKDSVTVKVGPEGKRAHFVEILNIVDVGTSLLVATTAREDFHAETSLASVIAVLKEQGVPESVTFDRDPRWVGSYSGRDFPSAFVKFWHCIGVKVNVCPPHRPDLNGVVERFHRALGQECLKVHHPESLGQVCELLPRYQHHYNFERPHQGQACRNQPPRVAFPELPARPSLPLVVNPDSWLKRVEGNRYVRRVDYKGAVKLDKHRYYVGRDFAGQYVSLEIDAGKAEVVVVEAKKLAQVKRLYYSLRATLPPVSGRA